MKKKIYAYNNIYFFMYMCLYICVYTRVCVCDSVEIKKNKKTLKENCILSRLQRAFWKRQCNLDQATKHQICIDGKEQWEVRDIESLVF